MIQVNPLAPLRHVAAVLLGRLGIDRGPVGVQSKMGAIGLMFGERLGHISQFSQSDFFLILFHRM